MGSNAPSKKKTWNLVLIARMSVVVGHAVYIFSITSSSTYRLLIVNTIILNYKINVVINSPMAATLISILLKRQMSKRPRDHHRILLINWFVNCTYSTIFSIFDKSRWKFELIIANISSCLNGTTSLIYLNVIAEQKFDSCSFAWLFKLGNNKQAIKCSSGP